MNDRVKYEMLRLYFTEMVTEFPEEVIQMASVKFEYFNNKVNEINPESLREFPVANLKEHLKTLLLNWDAELQADKFPENGNGAAAR